MIRYDVSLILSTFNSDKYIENYYNNIIALKSVAKIQLIHILNDPTELEKSFIEKFKKVQFDPEEIVFDYKYLIVQRETLYASWNRAIELCDARLISIFNVDDLRYPDGLKLQIRAFDKVDDLLLMGSHFYVNRDQEVLERPSFESAPKRKELISGMYLGPFFIWTNPTIFGLPHIKFDEQFKVAGDFDFQIRFTSLGRVEILNYYVGEFYDAGFGLSTQSILQRIEGQVIYIRYCIVDKLVLFSSLLVKMYNYSVSMSIVDGKSINLYEIEPHLNTIRSQNLLRRDNILNKIRMFIGGAVLLLKSVCNKR